MTGVYTLITPNTKADDMNEQTINNHLEAVNTTWESQVMDGVTQVVSNIIS